MPRLIARLRARRVGRLFVDVVSDRDVWAWETRDGKQYLGDSRWGMWVERRHSTNRDEMRLRLQALRFDLGQEWSARYCAVPDGGCGACWVCRLEERLDEAIEELSR